MKGLFKSKPRTPVEMVQHLHELLLFVLGNTETREKKRAEKIAELDKLLLDIRTVLFGDGQVEPNAESCAQLTKEFFQKDTFRLLIDCLPSLDSGARQNATHVIANLQRQKVNSKVLASEYLGNNLDIMDTLLPGYEDDDIAWTYGSILRECIRHQNVARYVLESDHMKKFFVYLQNPNFDIASDVQATFKVEYHFVFFFYELLTRHKSTVAEFLSANYDWFFHEYNTKLLQSESYITRRHAVKLLGDMLLDRSNSAVMVRYVTSLEHMRIMMNLLRESNKTIKLDTFHVFKLFVANQNKPAEIISVLVTNRSKLLRFFSEFNIDKADEQFEADKSQIIKEIATLQQPSDRPCQDLDSL
ncbi:hypothetical protein V6N13_046073 [Hibiscus sabdariffa]